MILLDKEDYCVVFLVSICKVKCLEHILCNILLSFEHIFFLIILFLDFAVFNKLLNLLKKSLKDVLDSKFLAILHAIFISSIKQSSQKSAYISSITLVLYS